MGLKFLILVFLIQFIYCSCKGTNNDSIINLINKQVNTIDSIKDWPSDVNLFNESVFYGRKCRRILGLRIPINWNSGSGGYTYYFIGEDSVEISIFNYGCSGIHNPVKNITKDFCTKEYYLNNQVVAYKETNTTVFKPWFLLGMEEIVKNYNAIIYIYDKKIIYYSIEGDLYEKEKYMENILKQYSK